MATRALVLGGGGPVGIAWESGLAAGLEAEGVRLADAGLIVGTSAGSVVGAQLALGRPPQELVEVQRALTGAERAANRGLTPEATAAVLQAMRKWFAVARTTEVLTEIGVFALAAQTMTEEESLAGFGSMKLLRDDTWPERRFVCTAVDTADGRFVAWDKDSGVPLRIAVASSCAVPGLFPAITINGRRYMDGGMRSLVNAGLALGSDRVLVVLVTPAIPGATEAFRQRIEPELDELRAGGSDVALVVPDAAALEAFGPNLLDGTRRAAIADAGLRQGAAEAARLRPWWTTS